MEIATLKRAVIKEEYIAITGNIMEAVCLNQMIYWSERTGDFDKFIREEKKRQVQTIQVSPDKPLLCGWIYKSAAELKDEVMSVDSLKTISRKLDALVEKGFLMRRNNPNVLYDRTYQYRVNLIAIIKALHTKGYTLEGYKVDLSPSDNLSLPEGADNNPQDGDNSAPEQRDDSIWQSDKWKGQNDECNGHSDKSNRHSVETVPETTSEITPESSLSSPSYSPKGRKAAAKMEDDKADVSTFLEAMGIEQLRHKDMIAPVKLMISELLTSGKVGRNRFRLSDVADSLRLLTASDVDAIIDRFAGQRKKAGISCPEDYIKTCLMRAGQAAKIAKAAGNPYGEGIHCGNPSYDIDDFVALHMQLLHNEGEK